MCPTPRPQLLCTGRSTTHKQIEPVPLSAHTKRVTRSNRRNRDHSKQTQAMFAFVNVPAPPTCRAMTRERSVRNIDREQAVATIQRTADKARGRWETASPKQRKIFGGITAGVLLIGAINMFGGGDETGPSLGTRDTAGLAQDAAGMTPGDIGRWAEDLEDEYLAEYGYTEFMDAEDAPGTVPSAITTFDATTYGELKVYVPAWISDADAEVVAEDVATTVAGASDAPSTVVVSTGWDKPALATQRVN